MGLRLGYLVPEFPSLTHVMFWREVLALRSMGIEVFLLSTRSPRSVIHDFCFGAAAETRYLFPPAIPNFAAWFASGCGNFLQARAYLGKLENAALINRPRQYVLLASAVELVQRERSSTFTANLAHVLALARCLGMTRNNSL